MMPKQIVTPKLSKCIAKDYVAPFEKKVAVITNYAVIPEFHGDWLELRSAYSYLIPPNKMESINCAMEIEIPYEHEICFRNVQGNGLLAVDGSRMQKETCYVIVKVVNFNEYDVHFKTGDLICEMCVRPVNSISIEIGD